MIIDVSSSTMRGAELTRDWAQQARGRVLCPRCRRVDRRIHPKPIHVDLSFYEPGPIILVAVGYGRVCVDLYHVGFIKQIRQHMSGFVFGRCHDEKGRLIKDYVTIYTNHTILLHHDKSISYTRCGVCRAVGSTVLFPPGYFLRRELPPGSVYQKSSWGLFLDSDLADGLDFSAFPDVQLYRYEVRDDPLPGWRSPDDPDIPEWGVESEEAKQERRRSQEWLERMLQKPDRGHIKLPPEELEELKNMLDEDWPDLPEA